MEEIHLLYYQFVYKAFIVRIRLFINLENLASEATMSSFLVPLNYTLNCF